jgi:rhamnulokinase
VAVSEICHRTGQPVPATRGEFVRTVTDSLALKCGLVLAQLERLLGHQVDLLHIIGGGSLDGHLNQRVADATGRPVEAGPAEATAAGNVLVQMLADGAVGSHAEARAVIRRSFPAARFDPGADAGAWEEARGRFLSVTGAVEGAGLPIPDPG